jgi:hypothetical protein
MRDLEEKSIHMNDDPHTATRRGLLRRGLALTLTAPMLAAALQAAPALADDGDEDRDDRPHPAPPPPRDHPDPFTSDLVTVSQAQTSGDFTSGNPGTDPLVDGRVNLRRREDGTTEGRARIELRGAAANVSYDVFFQPFASGKAREGLGTIGPTNNSGNLNATTPSALNGTSRVGVFVLARTSDGSAQAGKDEFVSSLGG